MEPALVEPLPSYPVLSSGKLFSLPDLTDSANVSSPKGFLSKDRFGPMMDGSKLVLRPNPERLILRQKLLVLHPWAELC